MRARIFGRMVLATALAMAMLAPAALAGMFDKIPGVGSVSEIRRRTDQVQKVAKATTAATAEITDEQEYYIGRAVAATILKQYKVWDNPAANAYVSKVGQALALVSARPQTFGGYHFLVLDSDEINAFAAPGGLILVSRGLLRCCASEDELAAVLAHEIGHVQLKHGLGAIGKSRLMDLGGFLAKQGAAEVGSTNLNKLTRLFGQSVGDVTKTLMISGYSRSQEAEADMAAVRIMRAMGYQPAALISMLKKMKARYPKSKVGFAKTHPDPLDRAAGVRKKIGKDKFGPPEIRIERFAKSLSDA